jgi:hypothetical protein
MGGKSVGRVNRAPCSQFPYDYSLDNMAPHYVKFALQVAAKITSRTWALIYVQVIRPGTKIVCLFFQTTRNNKAILKDMHVSRNIV